MAFYKIEYGVSCDECTEYIEADNYNEATRYAWEKACEYYDSFGGLHGIPSESQVAAELFGDEVGSDEEGDMEDGSTIFEHLSDEQIEEVGYAYQEERESWISYSAKEVSQREYETQGGEEEEEDEEE